MVALNKKARSPRVPAWHKRFLKLLPLIRWYAHRCFRRLTPELQEECIQEAVCNACCAVARLAELGRLDLVYGSPLARYAVAQVRAGRRVGGRLNCRDVLSDYCQQKKRLAVQRLDRYDRAENVWKEAVVQDTRTAPVADVVRFRVDFDEWLSRLPRRKRRVAQCLALGHRTKEAAQKFRVTAGRIAQLRSEFFESWNAFQAEPQELPATV